MAFAFGFPRDTTALIESLWDWRYRLVRGGGKTPSASAMPLPVPPHRMADGCSANMEHGKFYYQRMESGLSGHDWIGRPLPFEPHAHICIWEGYKPRHCKDFDRRAGLPIKSFSRCSSKDVRPRDLAALCSTCDACESLELELQRSHF